MDSDGVFAYFISIVDGKRKTLLKNWVFRWLACQSAHHSRTGSFRILFNFCAH